MVFFGADSGEPTGRLRHTEPGLSQQARSLTQARPEGHTVIVTYNRFYYQHEQRRGGRLEALERLRATVLR